MRGAGTWGVGVLMGVAFGLSTLDLRGPDRGVMLLPSKPGADCSSLCAIEGVPLVSERGGLRVEVVEGVEPAILGVKGVLFWTLVVGFNSGRG